MFYTRYHPGGYCPGGFSPGGFCPGGILSGGYCPGGYCPRTVLYSKTVDTQRRGRQVPGENRRLTGSQTNFHCMPEST